MNAPDLETRIRSYYKSLEPEDSTRLMLASRTLLDEARRPRPTRLLWGSLRLAATLAAAAVLLAVLVLPRFAPALGPGSGTASPSTASPSPTFDLTATLNAQVNDAGLMRSGGIWAVQGPYLLTSTDNGQSWRAGNFPASATPVFVLDPDHAWTITANQGNPAPTGQLLINRTEDGGRTWRQTSVSRDFPCDMATLSFVDADHGFLMCSVASKPGPDGPIAQARAGATKGSGTVLRTNDGGASWSIAGSATGLGSAFTASDSNTLWSAPDHASSKFSGVTLAVSRDAGLTWSTVDLPDLASVPAEAEVGVAAGPVFWDASNGAFAVGVFLNGSSTPPAIWFYRTSDAGRSWTVVKEPTEFPMMDFPPAALVGRQWAVRDLSLFGLTVSSDFGASWADVPGLGMPENTSFIWVDMTDKDHGVATVLAAPGALALMLSSDGGRTWHPANFGAAKTKVPSDSVGDAAAAKSLAGDFEMMANKDPATAWHMLSSYSQQAFGSYSAFEAAEAARGDRTDHTYLLGEPIANPRNLDWVYLVPGAWDDMARLADMSRAYVVRVTFSKDSETPRNLVMAPLAATGDWRIWVWPVTMP